MKHNTVITGAGIVSALGSTPAEVYAALCRGDRAGREICNFGDRELRESAIAAPIQGFSPEVFLGDQNFRPLDRTGQFAVAAAQLALDASGWTREMREEQEVDLVVGTTFCSAGTITEFDRKAQVSGPKYAKPLDFANTVINAAGGQTAIWHHLRGANTTVSAGKVSGLRALKYAQFQIENGESEQALVGGVEELCFETQFAFTGSGHIHRSKQATQATPFQQNREGFTLGEAGAFAMLEDAKSVKTRGASVLGVLLGHGASYDISRGSDELNAVERCAGTIRDALEDASTLTGDVDCIVCSANGSRFEDRCEALALSEVFGDRIGTIPVTSVCASLGETLGATGLLQLITFLESAREGRLPGIPGVGAALDESLAALCVGDAPLTGQFTKGLLLSLGFDGSSAATVVSLPS